MMYLSLYLSLCIYIYIYKYIYIYILARYLKIDQSDQSEDSKRHPQYIFQKDPQEFSFSSRLVRADPVLSVLPWGVRK